MVYVRVVDTQVSARVKKKKKREYNRIEKIKKKEGVNRFYSAVRGEISAGETTQLLDQTHPPTPCRPHRGKSKSRALYVSVCICVRSYTVFFSFL